MLEFKEIEIDNQVRLKLIKENHTASVIASPKASGNVFIPSLIEFEGETYEIKTVEEKAFKSTKIESLLFASNSKISSFEDIIQDSSIKKLQIPSSVKFISKYCFSYVKNLVEIEISPHNHYFSFVENKYLIGKSDKYKKLFDVLYYVNYDIEEAIIPSCVKIVNPDSLSSPKLKSVIFPSNSELKFINEDAIILTSFAKLVLPATLEEIGRRAFYSCRNLVDVEVSQNNPKFKSIDNKYLVKKCDESKEEYELIFCRRDIEDVQIPSCIRKIGIFAFSGCKKMKSLVFETNTSLKNIGPNAFQESNGLTNIVIPQSIENVGACAFDEIQSLISITFLAKNVEIEQFCFMNCKNLAEISFPNATHLTFQNDSMKKTPENMIIKIRKDSEQFGSEFNKISERIQYFEEQNLINNNNNNYKIENKNEDTDKKMRILLNRIRFLECRLSKYEDITPFNEQEISNLEEKEISMNEERGNEVDIKQKNYFIDEDDESHQHVLCKIGEGAASIAYKIIDERDKQIMCKKVLKADEKKTTFKDFQNIYKEFEVLQKFHHPCICESIGMNPQEKVPTDSRDEILYDDDDDYYFEEKQDSRNKPITTIALFLKYYPFNLKEIINETFLSNTLKAKIAVEIAFGMSHIHSRGIIHRDLKLENVMLNYIFEVKLIDFGLVHVSELANMNESLTKGVGTLAYMSPEMQNEEEYDYKTDVYSFGVLLFVLFTKHFPKQSMKDKLTNQPIRFPRPSSCISEFCIELVKKCMSFEPSQRPTFDEILDDMLSHSFFFADEIDSELVNCRYKSLNAFRQSI